MSHHHSITLSHLHSSTLSHIPFATDSEGTVNIAPRAPFNFITHCFFLTHRCLILGIKTTALIAHGLLLLFNCPWVFLDFRNDPDCIQMSRHDENVFKGMQQLTYFTFYIYSSSLTQNNASLAPSVSNFFYVHRQAYTYLQTLNFLSSLSLSASWCYAQYGTGSHSAWDTRSQNSTTVSSTSVAAVSNEGTCISILMV